MLKNGLVYSHPNASGIESIELLANAQGISTQKAAALSKSPLVSKIDTWPVIDEIDAEIERVTVDICTSERGDLVTQLSKEIAQYIQFPVNTVFLHALGCVASALTKSFSIKYHYDEIPCNLYVITAQPPSSGKSAVNSMLFSPIRKASQALNDKNDTERNKLKFEIAKLKKEIEKEKSIEGEYEEISDKINQKEVRLNEIPEWQMSLTDTTIEAAESTASQQQGMFNIISAEAESINVIVGAVYGDSAGGKKANHGLLLSAWDGEYVNSARITRTGYKGHVRSTISVIAQEDSIDTILAAGASGRGLTERFLLLLENSFLGSRDHLQKRIFNKSIHRQYESLIENIINEESVLLSFDSESDGMIRSYLTKLEPTIADDGENSSALLTGFVGKADKHIRKISAVLHCIDNWQDGGDRSTTISTDHVIWAIGIYDELKKTFANASDFLGYVGKNSEIDKIKSTISRFAEKNKLKVSIRYLIDAIKNVKPFRGSRNLTKKIRQDILPMFESAGYLVVINNDIYINPRLR